MTGILAENPRTKVDALVGRGTRVLAVFLLLSLIGFAAYYYFDRAGLSSPSLADRAIADLEGLVRQEPNNANLRVQVALAYSERQMVAPAVAQFKAALEIAPDHQPALIGLGNALLAQDDEDGALAAYNKVVELNKDNPYRKTLRQLEAVYYRLALIQQRRGDLDAAATNLSEALDIDRTDADAWYLLGEVRRGQQQAQPALEAYQKAVSLDPRFADAYTAMAAIYAQMSQPALVDYANGMAAVARRDYGRALPLLQQSTAAAATNPDAFLGLGQAYENLGRPADALAAYEAAVRLAPHNFLAQTFLERAKDKQQSAEVRR